jgi:NADPH:quinone reductase-like Zn-dependent oxidoreductase
MKSIRVHAFGGIDAMIHEDVPVPAPGPGQVLVRVAAAGVGPWDAWVRAGKSVLPQPLPLTLGADFSGTVEVAGSGVDAIRPGLAVYGATNPRFTGAYADYALAEATMIAPKPGLLTDAEAGSVAVVACTAHQMLFEDARVEPGNTVAVLGGGGNVGSYAVQLAVLAGAQVIATGRRNDLERIRALGAAAVVPADEPPPPELASRADLVVDTVGGGVLDQAFDWLRPGGTLLSAVAEPDRVRAARHGSEARFILVKVTTDRLRHLASLFDTGRLKAKIGREFKLSEARLAHRLMEAGAPAGKIVLLPDPPKPAGQVE